LAALLRTSNVYYMLCSVTVYSSTYCNVLFLPHNAVLQGADKKPLPLQKSHYFQNSLIFFGELFRGYSWDILPLVLQILAFLLQFYRNRRGLNIKDDFLKCTNTKIRSKPFTLKFWAMTRLKCR